MLATVRASGVTQTVPVPLLDSAARRRFQVAHFLASAGGGVLLTSDEGSSRPGASSLVISGSDISRNHAGGSGGGVAAPLRLRVNMSGTVVRDNRASSGGGMIFGNESAVTLTETVCASNVAAPGDGGGLVVGAGSTAAVSRSNFSSNAAASGAGGAFALLGRAALFLDDSSVTANDAFMGGFLAYIDSAAAGSNVELRNLAIAGNTAASGSLYSSGASIGFEVGDPSWQPPQECEATGETPRHHCWRSKKGRLTGGTTTSQVPTCANCAVQSASGVGATEVATPPVRYDVNVSTATGKPYLLPGETILVGIRAYAHLGALASRPPVSLVRWGHSPPRQPFSKALRAGAASPTVRSLLTHRHL